MDGLDFVCEHSFHDLQKAVREFHKYQGKKAVVITSLGNFWVMSDAVMQIEKQPKEAAYKIRKKGFNIIVQQCT